MESTKEMIKIYDTPLNKEVIEKEWFDSLKKNNSNGAFVTFTGIIRDENKIEGLSFDVYEPILEKWFAVWDSYTRDNNSKLFMAHSKGDVKLGEISFMCAVASPKRRFALEMMDTFVEDFKANAPIWKYDLKDGERAYAADRSQKIEGSGLLA